MVTYMINQRRGGPQWETLVGPSGNEAVWKELRRAGRPDVKLPPPPPPKKKSKSKSCVQEFLPILKPSWVWVPYGPLVKLPFSDKILNEIGIDTREQRIHLRNWK